MYLGTVLSFNNRPGKQFGFIAPDNLEYPDIFFHITDGQKISVGDKGINFKPQMSERVPQKGDRVVFRIRMAKKGPKAFPWAYEEEYREALAKVIGETSSARCRIVYEESDELVIKWGGIFGSSLEDLCVRFPREKGAILQSPSGVHYRIQVNDGSGWRDTIEDPRPIVSGTVRERK